MTREVFPPLLLLLVLLLPLFGASQRCLQDPVSAYRFTGTVCRLTHPAAVVLNEKTTKVIEAAFQHAKYPSVKGEKSLLFVGRVTYGLENLEIHNLSIGRSAFELRAGEGIAMEISNVSAIFRGTIQYGYGSWLVNLGHSIDFEVDSQIDLGINPKLYCGKGKVAADTSDCYLNFHKLHLHLQGDKEPNWLKKLFTDFITFTVKLVVKGQICKEINKVANILADFIQDTAGECDFLSDGDISVDIGITTAPVITANYIESYHKVSKRPCVGLDTHTNHLQMMKITIFHHEQCRCVLPVSVDTFRHLNQPKIWLNTDVFHVKNVTLDVRASYANKKVFLHVLEVEITRVLDKQGTNLFDIENPEVLPRDGFVVIQMDFGFPHHLLVQFLKRTLQ
uniref:Cholesteryl ester transfer protein, plasma n=1 Tax=Echeneis naucrates TaxID=173247 RepID=A0A665TD13_ECHNA